MQQNARPAMHLLILYTVALFLISCSNDASQSSAGRLRGSTGNTGATTASPASQNGQNSTTGTPTSDDRGGVQATGNSDGTGSEDAVGNAGNNNQGSDTQAGEASLPAASQVSIKSKKLGKCLAVATAPDFQWVDCVPTDANQLFKMTPSSTNFKFTWNNKCFTKTVDSKIAGKLVVPLFGIKLADCDAKDSDTQLIQLGDPDAQKLRLIHIDAQHCYGAASDAGRTFYGNIDCAIKDELLFEFVTTR